MRDSAFVIMNARERFLEVALFGNPDRIPLDIWSIRPATRRSWIEQGLPENADIQEYLNVKECCLRSKNITSYPSEGFEWEPSPLAVNLGPIPPFNYKIIREDERYRVWVDSLGVTQLGFQDDWKHGWSGFATRVFMDFPVKNRKDFLEMKKRYDPRDPRRYPKNWSKIVETYRGRDHPVCVTIRGPFWWTRDMVGLKGIARGIYERPELTKEIMDFCGVFHAEALHRALDEIEVDYVILNEDMGYKKGPMMGPEAVRKFMGQAYRELVKFFRDHGVKAIIVDSDGNVEPLIPVWLELGINGVSPCEVAADMDVVKLGKQYPDLILMGGIDKRQLTKDKKAVEREVMYRVPPLVKRRGYFPGVDHAVPPDISLENFKHFISLLKKVCGWLD
ncbi:MAG: uroporphyrinogen decarboxylase family protein [Candidatus Bathyarchaeia archaeon]